MLHIVLYFQVHQPHRLRPYRVLDIGAGDYFDDDLNRRIIDKVAGKCYLPANSLLQELVARHGDRFKVSFSMTGTPACASCQVASLPASPPPIT